MLVYNESSGKTGDKLALQLKVKNQYDTPTYGDAQNDLAIYIKAVDKVNQLLDLSATTLGEIKYADPEQKTQLSLQLTTTFNKAKDIVEKFCLWLSTSETGEDPTLLFFLERFQYVNAQMYELFLKEDLKHYANAKKVLTDIRDNFLLLQNQGETK